MNIENIRKIPTDRWEKCPNCDNEGVYPEHEPCCDGSCVNFQVPVQCEFCWTNNNSIFNQIRLLQDKSDKYEYWEKRCKAAEGFINSIIHDPGFTVDIPSHQHSKWNKWQSIFLEEKNII